MSNSLIFFTGRRTLKDNKDRISKVGGEFVANTELQNRREVHQDTPRKWEVHIKQENSAPNASVDDYAYANADAYGSSFATPGDPRSPPAVGPGPVTSGASHWSTEARLVHDGMVCWGRGPAWGCPPPFLRKLSQGCKGPWRTEVIRCHPSEGGLETNRIGDKLVSGLWEGARNLS